MPYNLSKTKDVMKIAEQEYGSASEIKFTAFTSCIGILARKGGTITAVHLVMSAKDKTPYDTNTAAATLALLPDTADEAYIIGNPSMWQNPDNGGIVAAFEKLTGGMKTLKKVELCDFASGSYGAKLDDSGDIELTY